MPPSARTSLAILALAALAGCTGSPPPREETAWRDDRHPLPALSLPPLMAAACPGGERPGADAPFTIALPGAVDPDHVPLPATEAERHLFRNCWETLVRIDCEGRLEPGLARSWQAYDGGRSWIFQLRDQARFWDGTPLGAIHVVDSWRRTESLCQERGEPPPFLRFSPRGASLQVLGARELAIHLESPEDWLPWLLAHPGLAVAGPRDEHGWPLGSGPLRPDGPVVDETLLLVPVDGHPDAPRWPSATVRLGDRSDAREHLDTGAQALVTREREVVAYYAARPGTRVEPLPWDRSYYLVVPTEETGSLPRDRRRWTSGWDALELAREVSTQDAEPAAFFLLEPLHGACPVLPPHVPVLDPPGLGGLAVRASRDTDLILWPANDPDAGRLAGRLAALAARPLGPAPERPGTGPLTPPVPPGPGAAPEAVAVPAFELAAHVQAGRAGAIVLPWPHRWPLPCDDLGRLLSLAEWLIAAGYEPEIDIRAVPPGATPARPHEDYEPPQALAVARRLERNQVVLPLLRTRAALVRDPRLLGLACDHDGALRLWTAGWRDDPADGP